MVRVLSISLRPQFNNFSRDTVPLKLFMNAVELHIFNGSAESQLPIGNYYAADL